MNKELIIFILKNNLTDYTICSVDRAAVEMGCGVSTILTLVNQNKLPHFKTGTECFVFLERTNQ